MSFTSTESVEQYRVFASVIASVTVTLTLVSFSIHFVTQAATHFTRLEWREREYREFTRDDHCDNFSD